MIFRIMACLVVLNFIVILVVTVTGNKFFDTRDAAVNRLLKKLNKPYVKSIKSPNGDIIDCVHMKNHPIYDNPLFKNHTIQMRPNFYPKGWTNKYSNNKKQNMVAQLWTINGICPKNSIPIRRTRKEDILRAKSIEEYGKKDPNDFLHHKPINQPRRANETHEYAIIRVVANSPHAKFHGAQSYINVWRPFVQEEKEFSLAQVWVAAGSYSTQLNTIEAGWQVCYGLYGDHQPHYFIYWTADSYVRTGCYNNIGCTGFVNINQAFALGSPIPQVSAFGGLQVDLLVSIWKDPSTGNWWLKFGPHLYVGYWPSTLFNHLQNGGTEVHWGGEIINLKNYSRHTSTVMGSGLFAEEGFKKASYIKNIEVLDENNIVRQPVDVYSAVTDGSCYSLRFGTNHSMWKTHFFYGGPGGNNPFCTL
ncbi:hypothetical protein CARUB_v10015743mg [Capsella rubella]|uniref:Neprosin PEP catalytic domain-containing protein n=1 Tax=Capsella rubella TaxID=81985 RepID=R0GA78_9BRAS|nr:uncharacterized protein LOC17892994 [Capsella rubella]EOA32466.1 hypothetical protein CARUB_v10015743mg [Capsella rubella]